MRRCLTRSILSHWQLWVTWLKCWVAEASKRRQNQCAGRCWQCVRRCLVLSIQTHWQVCTTSLIFLQVSIIMMNLLCYMKEHVQSTTSLLRSIIQLLTHVTNTIHRSFWLKSRTHLTFLQTLSAVTWADKWARDQDCQVALWRWVLTCSKNYR